MAVVIETTLGDITVDLYLDQRPVTCLNFLKLCKMKYYNFNLFHTIRNGFIAQTGDPTGEGSGGQSIWGILEGPEKRFFSGEKMPKIRHTDAGLLSMVCTDDMMVGSQFFLTLAPDLDSLDGTHCVIGEVTEGREVLTKINEVICDENHRPYRDVRITHTVVLEDPFSDPVGLRAPSRSPSPNPERLKGGRIAPDEEIDELQGRSVEEIQEMIEEKEAKARATILEIVGDLPDAEIAPPENVLFVCKLNPVTTDEDLEIIFSRFGTIVSCEVIKDKKNGNSLQYAFIEFENKKSCEDAYFKMDNVLIDDRRIHVDFSQSVSKMRWLGKGRGVQYFDNDSKQIEEKQDSKDKRRYRNESKKNNCDNRRDNEREHDGDIEQKYNRDRKQKNEKDRERRHDRDRDHKYDRDREHRYKEPDHDRGHKHNRHKAQQHSREEEQNHDKRYSHNRDKEQKHGREEEQSRDRQQRQYRDKEKRYKRDGGNPKQRSRSRSRLNESQKNRQESDRDSVNVSKNGNTYNIHRSRSDKLKDSVIRNNRPDFTTLRSNEESKYKERRIDEKQKGDMMRHSNHTEQHNYEKYTESLNETKRSGQHNEEPLTPSPTLKRKNNKLSKTKSSKNVNKRNKRKKKSRTSVSSESSSSSSSSDSSSSSESDRKKKKLRRRRKYSTSSSSTDSSSSSSSFSSSSSSSSDSEDKKKIKKKNSKNKQKV